MEYLLLVLPCAAMMGVMMWMMRGKSSSDTPQPDRQQEIDALRTEIEDLGRNEAPGRAEQDRA